MGDEQGALIGSSARTTEAVRVPHGVPIPCVHRATTADVLLAGGSQIGEDSSTLRAHWPAFHDYFTSVCGGFNDSFLVAGTVHQAGSLLAHAEYRVPREEYFRTRNLGTSGVVGSLPVPYPAAELGSHDRRCWIVAGRRRADTDGNTAIRVASRG